MTIPSRECRRGTRVNTRRGALVDTRALIRALKKGRLGAVGLDVYEEESHIFFEDLSDEIIPDDVIERLFNLPNALVTGHQAFFTEEAMGIIAKTTIQNISDFAAGHDNENILKPKMVIKNTNAIGSILRRNHERTNTR